MKKNPTGTAKRLVAAMLVTAAVAGVSALSMQAPTLDASAMARPLKNIQTDKATQFYADPKLSWTHCVERVPAMTGESKDLTENLKLVAAAF